MPTIGALRLCGRPDPAGARSDAGDRPVVAGVAEGEDAAVGGHQPVAGLVGVGLMPTTGRCRVMPPVDP
jgi:hypothetical protein